MEKLHHSNGAPLMEFLYIWSVLSSRADAINAGVLPDLCCTPGIVATRVTGDLEVNCPSHPPGGFGIPTKH